MCTQPNITIGTGDYIGLKGVGVLASNSGVNAITGNN